MFWNYVYLSYPKDRYVLRKINLRNKKAITKHNFEFTLYNSDLVTNAFFIFYSVSKMGFHNVSYCYNRKHRDSNLF